MISQRSRRLLVAGAVLFAASTTVAPTWSSAAASDPSGWQVVADHLDNPRGITFDASGRMYVAEAGRGGYRHCQNDPESGSLVCAGFSGSVTRVANGHQYRVAKYLPSFATKGTGAEAGGPSDIIVNDDGSLFVVEQGVGTVADRVALGTAYGIAGRLMRVDPRSGKVSARADLMRFEQAANPDGGEIDSDPYAATVAGDRILVADAAGNDIVAVARNGRGPVNLVATLDSRMVDAPPFLNAPAGTKLPMQSVPDALAVGPDGTVYIGELTGFPFVTGAARVMKLAPDGTVTLVKDGFTNIIDLAVAADGTVYVLEIAHTGLLDPASTGGLSKIAPDGTVTLLETTGLDHPAGLAIGPDGALYISNHGTSAGIGQVIRIPV